MTWIGSAGLPDSPFGTYGEMPGRFEAGGIVPSWKIFVGSGTPWMVAREPTALPVLVTVTDTTWPFLVQVVVYPVAYRSSSSASCWLVWRVDPLQSPTQPARPAQTSTAATSATSRLAMRSSVAHFRMVCWSEV